MKIQSINTYYPNFTSSVRVVYDSDLACNRDFGFNRPEIKHRNTTFFYRKDLNWISLSNFLLSKYKNTEKVNTYCYACSDGSEPYSLIMKLKTDAPTQAKKFFPIIAKDYDQEIIKQAKSDTIYIDYPCVQDIHSVTRGNFNKFFDYIEEDDSRNDGFGRVFKVRPELSNNVTFELADICEDVKNIKPDNSVVFCRNFWPYLKTPKRMDDLAQNLHNQLGKNSIIILGNYDYIGECNLNCGYNAYASLYKAGFSLVEPDLRIFEKPDIKKNYY